MQVLRTFYSPVLHTVLLMRSVSSASIPRYPPPLQYFCYHRARQLLSCPSSSSSIIVKVNFIGALSPRHLADDGPWPYLTSAFQLHRYLWDRGAAVDNSNNPSEPRAISPSIVRLDLLRINSMDCQELK